MEYIQVIQEVGFNIAALVAMGFFIKYMFDKYEKRLTEQRNEFTETLKNITESHAEEAKEQRIVTEKLSESINKLSERMAAWEARMEKEDT